MNAKPDFKSYMLRQLSFKRYPWVIRAKDGYFYEEIHGRLHNIITTVFHYIIGGAIFKNLVINNFASPNFWVFFVLTIIILAIMPFIYMITIGRLLFQFYKFEKIDEERLKEYPGIKL